MSMKKYFRVIVVSVAMTVAAFGETPAAPATPAGHKAPVTPAKKLVDLFPKGGSGRNFESNESKPIVSISTESGAVSGAAPGTARSASPAPDKRTAYIVLKVYKAIQPSKGAKDGVLDLLTNTLVEKSAELRSKCLEVSYEYTTRIEVDALHHTNLYIKCLPRPDDDVAVLFRRYICEQLLMVEPGKWTKDHEGQFTRAKCSEIETLSRRIYPATQFDEITALKLIQDLQ